MIIRVQRKYAITTQFLDTTLETEEEWKEGETREAAILRAWDDLDRIAEARRKQAHPHLYQEERSAVSVQQVGYVPPPIIVTTATNSAIDYKKFDELEIAIDNAQSLENLDKIKSDNPIFPAKLLNTFNEKRKELSK